jgi:DNA-binding NtrC family response regulator
LDLDGEHSLRGSVAPSSVHPNAGSTGNEVQVRWKQLGEQKEGLDALEKGIIEDALAACGGIVARTARMLSVPRTGLISRMATLEIDPEKFKNRG